MDEQELAPVTLGFDAFFRAEYRRVVGLALVLCGRRSVAEELAQDAFVAAFRHWDRVGGYDDPAVWVRRVAVNLATSWMRRRTREIRALTRLASRREDESGGRAVNDDDRCDHVHLATDRRVGTANHEYSDGHDRCVDRTGTG